MEQAGYTRQWHDVMVLDVRVVSKTNAKNRRGGACGLFIFFKTRNHDLVCFSSWTTNFTAFFVQILATLVHGATMVMYFHVTCDIFMCCLPSVLIYVACHSLSPSMHEDIRLW